MTIKLYHLDQNLSYHFESNFKSNEDKLIFMKWLLITYISKNNHKHKEGLFKFVNIHIIPIYFIIKAYI